MTVLAEYDENWATQYELAAAELREVFGDTVTEIEHIAKTELVQELTDEARAVRGLPSVPVWET